MRRLDFSNQRASNDARTSLEKWGRRAVEKNRNEKWGIKIRKKHEKFMAPQKNTMQILHETVWRLSSGLLDATHVHCHYIYLYVIQFSKFNGTSVFVLQFHSKNCNHTLKNEAVNANGQF